MNTTTLLPLFLSACGGFRADEKSMTTTGVEVAEIDSNLVRDSFTPTVSAFNQAGTGFCVVDSPDRTMMIKDYEVDISSEISYVSLNDQIVRADGNRFWSCWNVSSDTGVAVDYFDDAFQETVRTYLQARQSDIEDGFYFTAGARAIIERNGLVADKFLASIIGASILKDMDGVIVAAHDENIFGDNAAYGRAVYRSSQPDTLELHTYDRNVLRITESGPRLIDVDATQLFDLKKMLAGEGGE